MGDAQAGTTGSRRRWVWLAAAVVLVALVTAGALRALTAGATERPVAAATVPADRGPVTTEVATTGTLQPAQTRSLAFAVAGTIEQIAVRPGTTVTPGQTLARVDDSAAADAVDSAQDALADAEDALTEAKSAAAQAEADEAKAATCASAAPATRTSPAPQPTCAGPTQQGQGQGQGGDAILSAEQRVNKATVTLAEARDALDGAIITAPIAGRILSVAGTVGKQVTAGTAVVTLADIKDMRISADFPEADADRLAVKQKAAVTLADRAGETFAATVVQVDPVGTSDETMVRYGVLLSFDKAPADLLVGQSANVRVTTGAKDDVLRVPSTAVHDVTGDSGTIRRADGSTASVGVGLRGDTYTEITSGLTEADPVVRSW